MRGTKRALCRRRSIGAPSTAPKNVGHAGRSRANFGDFTARQRGDESGLGDIVQSFFFSPKEPVGGWILAAGPVALWPTATDSALGSANGVPGRPRWLRRERSLAS
jgi:hypothetical protein